MAFVLRRHEEKHVITPCGGRVEIADVGINGFQNLAQVVVFAQILIHPHGNQFNGRISGAFSHSVNRTVHQQVSFRM